MADNSDDRRANEEDESEIKLAVEERSKERSHSTEHGEDDPITDINVTPLVDVALVLVIIFMAVSPFMLQAGLQVSESKAGAATGKHSLEENVQVSLLADGTVQVNGETVTAGDLREVLKVKIPKSKDGLVTVQAEKENRVGQVVEVLDIAKQSGAKKVAILNKTEDKPGPESGTK